MNYFTNIFIYVAAADLNMHSLLRFTAKDLCTVSVKTPCVNCRGGKLMSGRLINYNETTQTICLFPSFLVFKYLKVIVAS